MVLLSGFFHGLIVQTKYIDIPIKNIFLCFWIYWNDYFSVLKDREYRLFVYGFILQAKYICTSNKYIIICILIYWNVYFKVYWSIFSIKIILCNIYYFYQFERRVQSVGQWPHCADQSPRSREGHSHSLTKLGTILSAPSLETFLPLPLQLVVVVVK